MKLLICLTSLFSITSKVEAQNSMSIIPNPLADSATVNITIDENDTVNLFLYNAIGELVDTMLYRGFMPKGDNKLMLYRDTLPNGVYVIVFRGIFSGQIIKKLVITDHLSGLTVAMKETPQASIYPNPTNNNILISINGLEIKDHCIIIENSIGEPIWIKNHVTSDVFEINTLDWPSGVYNFRIPSINYYHKIIVIH